jgi:hypothetical protein
VPDVIETGAASGVPVVSGESRDPSAAGSSTSLGLILGVSVGGAGLAIGGIVAALLYCRSKASWSMLKAPDRPELTSDLGHALINPQARELI